MVNTLLHKFDEAKGKLGMDFEGHSDDIQWVEVPSDRQMEDDGLTRDQIRNGGKFVYCIDNQLFDESGKLH